MIGQNKEKHVKKPSLSSPPSVHNSEIISTNVISERSFLRFPSTDIVSWNLLFHVCGICQLSCIAPGAPKISVPENTNKRDLHINKIAREDSRGKTMRLLNE